VNRRQSIILLAFIYVLAAICRLGTPDDLDNRDQAKQGLYVVDVVKNGKIFLPTLMGIEPATKPPLYNWIAAAISLAWGEVTEFTIRLPAVLCGLGVVLVTFLIGELLFSREVGLFAGLFLILNYHFTTLSCTARTDMMLCFFIAASLLCFLYAYRNPKGGQSATILIYVCMGLGSITKGPVALIIPALVILIFLFLRRDLQWLKSAKVGWGLAIWLVFMLGWFIPALIEGGREFFDTVIMDEMVNRFFGIGTRARKTQPFYYLIAHFFGKFLPWSLFIPSALVRYWKSRKKAQEENLLFPIIWLLTVLIFFSLSKGKRSDYVLPSYPAASIIVGHFWVTLIHEDVNSVWKKQLRALSAGYLAGCFILVIGLLGLLIVGGSAPAVANALREASQDLGLLHNMLAKRTQYFLILAVPLAVASMIGIVFAGKRSLRSLSMIMIVAAGLQIILYFGMLSPHALNPGGQQKKAFCERVKKEIDSVENLKFHRAPNSMLFYLGRNERLLSSEEAIEFCRETTGAYLITLEKNYPVLQEQAGFDFTILDETGSMIKKKRNYVLLQKK